MRKVTLMTMVGAVAAGLLAAVIGEHFTPRPEPLSGVPSVIDGDTLDLHGQRIRLHGIDAPESRQLCQQSGRSVRCGQAAALALDSLIRHRPVACEQKDKDRYGRIVAVCRVGATDLNGWMVQQGHALAYRAYSGDYVGQEAEARGAQRGVWSGTFDYPWDWRRGKRGEPSAPAPKPSTGVRVVTAGECSIKGNITAKGDRIYHTPESPWYGKTSINTAKGERWFCTEQEATAAGWRAARY